MKNFKTFEQFVNESVNESAKLVDEETGKEVKLPYKTKDFRGDPITVKGFTAPHKPSSSGRIQTDQGEYFPGVAGVKIIGHKYDDANESVNEAMVQVAGNRKPSGAQVLATVITEALTEEGYIQANSTKDISQVQVLIKDIIIKSTF